MCGSRPPRPGRIMPGTVWLRHAGYGVVEDWVGVGVGVEVGVTEADGVAEALGDELGVGELVVGDADGGVVGVVVADGEVDGERDGDAGAEVPRAGPTRFGVCAGAWPVNRRARAAMATPSTATASPVATPAANVRRSRRYSVVRRSRSQDGSAARRAARLLTGAAARPSVGNSSIAASSGPLNWLNLVSAPAMPAKPNRASADSAQLVRSACHHLVCSPVFGVRRNAAFLVNKASTEARATTSDVDCQMKNAPRASRQDAPVPRRSRAIARTRPSSTITGMAETR